MPTKIKYAYLKEQTWMFRRNYPEDVALVLGSKAVKQSLKTGDPRVAATRANEVTRSRRGPLSLNTMVVFLVRRPRISQRRRRGSEIGSTTGCGWPSTY